MHTRLQCSRLREDLPEPDGLDKSGEWLRLARIRCPIASSSHEEMSVCHLASPGISSALNLNRVATNHKYICPKLRRKPPSQP
jgi:hypothetical protein